jgi:hypothetical protein
MRNARSGATVAQLGRLDEGARLTQQVLDEAGRKYCKLDALYVDATHDLGAVRNAQSRYREALRAVARRRPRVASTSMARTTSSRRSHTRTSRRAAVARQHGRGGDWSYLAILDRLESHADADNTQLLTTQLKLSTLYAGLGEYSARSRAAAARRAGDASRVRRGSSDHAAGGR